MIKTRLTRAALMCAALFSSAALGAEPADHGAAKKTPVNEMCPIGKEPIVETAGTVDYKGKAIGLCCPGCGEQFLAWDEARKDEFVMLAAAHKEPGQEQHGAKPQNDKPWGEPYTLDTCPVSGEKLGEMGEPVVKEYDGREVRLCCAGCIKKFEADKDRYWREIDERIIKDQRRFYPTDKCLVTGEPLVENGQDNATEMVFGNRLIRLCCKMCVRKFKADPESFIKALDEETIEAQRKDYPLTDCVVGGGALGSMGDPVEMVVAGRLIRLCCAGCEPKIKSDPLKYIAMVDAAWNERGKFMPEHDDAHGSDHADHDGHPHE
ncbi:MAG: hypothetical protein KDA16_11365 [Phycisphaerales bacterium]|nr:hypothetical protein [Phycisphaerales bacterium]